MAKVKGRSGLSMTESQVAEEKKETIYVAMDRIPIKHFDRFASGEPIYTTDPKSKMPTAWYKYQKKWFEPAYWQKYFKRRRIVNPATGERIVLAW